MVYQLSNLSYVNHGLFNNLSFIKDKNHKKCFMQNFTVPVKKRRDGNYPPEKRPATNNPRKNPRFLLITRDTPKNDFELRANAERN